MSARKSSKKDTSDFDMIEASELALQSESAQGSVRLSVPRDNSALSAIVHAEIASADDSQDFSLRPKLLDEFLGQEDIKKNLGVFVKAARERDESLDHVFLIGPPGLGKTTLAQITANELGVDFKVTSAPALDKPKDLAGILSTITPRTVFFIDEIHRLKPAMEEMLYIAMED